MTKVRPFFAVPALGLFFGFAACGDDDAESSSDSLSEAEFLEAGNAICGTTNASIGGRVDELFAAGSPTDEAAQAALDFIVGESEAAGDALAALAEPPSMSDDVDALLAALDDANADAASQTGAAFFDTTDDPWADFGRQAVALGLDECAGE